VAKVRIEAPVKGESHRKTATPRTYSRARLSLTLLIISSVALYAWIQKKDRDGAGGWLADLKTSEGQKLVRFSALIIGALIALLAIGGVFAVDPTPSG
ncbi:MAG: hypothetical protein OXC60_16330, partial [Litoreibacter sp.]|nr:hypothetical protein [Litoreibacter sp.]